MQQATARLLPDGRRLHFNHGPIDLIVQAEGPVEEVRAAYEQAVCRFKTVLQELVDELPQLRRPAGPGKCPLKGFVARRMWDAVRPHSQVFVTPMAAVAGAVADEILSTMTAGRVLSRAYVNNGGDIALFLAPGAEPWRLGLVVDPANPKSPGALTVGPAIPARGVATSGRLGRSLSLGIADSVTVLARCAADADAAATLIANAVDLPGHPAIRRAPAVSLQPDSDLGERLVTTGVGALTAPEIARALAAGQRAAEDMRRRGLICSAVLVLGREVRLVGAPDLVAGPRPFRPPLPRSVDIENREVAHA